jgi:hypothetical protein
MNRFSRHVLSNDLEEWEHFAQEIVGCVTMLVF